jgi:hypothetical protein
MTERSNAMDFANGLQGAVEVITAGTAFFSPAQLAGQYAFEAVKDGGEGTPAEWATHLDHLESEGAVFDRAQALLVARTFAFAATPLRQYEVTACANTGEWLGEPEYICTVTRAEWDAVKDTDAVHFDTYEAERPESIDDGSMCGDRTETRAIRVVWVR